MWIIQNIYSPNDSSNQYLLLDTWFELFSWKQLSVNVSITPDQSVTQNRTSGTIQSVNLSITPNQSVTQHRTSGKIQSKTNTQTYQTLSFHFYHKFLNYSLHFLENSSSWFFLILQEKYYLNVNRHLQYLQKFKGIPDLGSGSDFPRPAITPSEKLVINTERRYYFVRKIQHQDSNGNGSTRFRESVTFLSSVARVAMEDHTLFINWKGLFFKKDKNEKTCFPTKPKETVGYIVIKWKI